MKLKIECKNLEGNIAWNVYIKKEKDIFEFSQKF